MSDDREGGPAIDSTVTTENVPAGGTVTFKRYGAAHGNSPGDNCKARGDTVGSDGLHTKAPPVHWPTSYDADSAPDTVT
jgi:hypothetical protein